MKEDTLQLEHLAPYLPYDLKFGREGQKFHEYQMKGLTPVAITSTSDRHYAYKSPIKPLLRPLSQLTQEIEHNGEKFKPYEKLRETTGVEWFYVDSFGDPYLRFGQLADVADQYEILSKLFEWHFDVFGLIEKGLAIELYERKEA